MLIWYQQLLNWCYFSSSFSISIILFFFFFFHLNRFFSWSLFFAACRFQKNYFGSCLFKQVQLVWLKLNSQDTHSLCSFCIQVHKHKLVLAEHAFIFLYGCLVFFNKLANISIAVNVYVPKDRVTNAHQGYGFVEFRSEEDADYVSVVFVCCSPFIMAIFCDTRQLHVLFLIFIAFYEQFRQ